jgi:FkbM family methyltransferase
LVPAIRYPEPIEFLNSRQIETVLDVGANEGQFAKELRDSGYSRRIISFEPVEAAFHRLAAAAHLAPPWEVHKLALGAASGTEIIKITAGDDMSSFKNFTYNAAKFASSRVVAEELVDITTLDAAVDGTKYNLGRCLLKIDTQGYEQEVLCGAKKNLPRMLGVLMELPIQHLYEGVWHIEDAISFMRARGFCISYIKPIREDKADPVSLFEVDILFKNERISS